MPGSAHEVLLASIHDRPALLDSLVTKLRGASLPPGLAPVDSNVRFVKTAEVRPDLLLAEERGERGPWAILELQRAIDPDKQRRWLLVASVLLDRTSVLGDVIVITARRSVARWAREVAHLVTRLGTRLALTPVVLHLSAAKARVLLDEQHPELALFAAWAMHHRHGPEAQEVVEQAIEVTARLPEPLREAQWRAILGVLSDRMIAAITENTMELSKIPERPAVRKLRLLLEGQGRIEGEREGELKGERGALFTILDARGLAVSLEERSVIEACTDPAQLNRWVRRAATARSTHEVLAAEPDVAPPSPPRRARRPKAARAR